MPATPAELCNLALGRIGIRADIQQLTDDNEEAIACNNCYGPARDRTLQAISWRFASRQATLALATVTRLNWDFVYRLPVDCLVPRLIVPDMQVPGPEDRIPFDWGDDAATGAILFTDREFAVLEYTAKFTDVARFTPAFVEAVAWRLAGDLALRLPNKTSLADGCEKQATRELLAAAAFNSNAAQVGRAPEADSIRVRGIAPDTLFRVR